MRVVIRPSVWLAVAVAFWAGKSTSLGVILGSVALHELGHLAAAQVLGCRVRCLTVNLMGCSLLLEPDPAMMGLPEIILALAGPLTSLLICFLIGQKEALFSAWQVNRMLAAFNLLPALPLDGGRALRCLLTPALGMGEATRTTARFSCLLAMGFLGWGMYQGAWNLCAAGLLVALEAIREARRADWLWIRMLTREKARRMEQTPMPLRQLTARFDMPVGEILRKFLPNYYYSVLVLDGRQRPMHVLDEERLVQALLIRGPGTPLGRIVP